MVSAETRWSSLEGWGRRAAGVAVAVAVVAIALGWNGSVLHSGKRVVRTASTSRSLLPVANDGPLPDLSGAVAWLNSVPLSGASLRGKVVLFDFWTYSCINSLRELPYVKAWAAKYKDAGLIVVGVHAPEFMFEKVRANVEWAAGHYQVTYPVPMDNNYGIWQAFNNQYWPADYLVDGTGRIRYHHFGEGAYGESERAIQKLLEENGATGVSESTVNISPEGIEAAPSADVRSPETYVGYRRAERFASSERVTQDSPQRYTAPARPALNEWGLGGVWNVGTESATLQAAPGTIVFRFHARDIHMVLAPMKDGMPVRIKVRLDGVAPGADAGGDTAPDGTGEIREPRLYQLIRQKGKVGDRTLEIEFLDPGVQAFAFTFG